MIKGKMRRLGVVFVCFFFLAIVLSGLQTESLPVLALENAGGQNSNVGNVVFSEDDFSATEDYAAWADAARVVSGESRLFDERREQKMRLDQGKAGLLLTTVRHGDDADGSSFSFANKIIGDFDMDFRIFSSESFIGKNSVGAQSKEIDGVSVANGTVFDPNFNPFPDVRTLSVTFTSVSDPEKGFTVFFESTTQWNLMRPSARVYIEGETFRDAGRKGYGVITASGQGETASGSAYFTQLPGTSFANVAYDAPESYSNRLIFDAENMCVLSRTYSLTQSSDSQGMLYEETDVLIRNLATNNMQADNGGTVVEKSGLKTLSQKDFASGYTVTVTMEDITADDTVLNAVTSEATEEDASGVYGTGTCVQKIKDAYDRYGKIILYSVNGQDMRVNSGFTVERQSFTFPNDSRTPYGNVTAEGYRFTANESNVAAEGNTITLDPQEFISDGAFTMAVGALAEKYGPAGVTQWQYVDNNEQHYDKNGVGSKMREIDPYSDVRELGVTFRSKTDPSKAFTVYIASRDTSLLTLGARVGIEGESYRTRSGLKGYGQNGTSSINSSQMWTQVAGTFGMGNNGSFDSYNTQANIYAPIKFDPNEMKLYVFAYGWAVCRDLTQSLAEGALTLDKADFENGYDVSISVELMNDVSNLGLKNIYSLSNNGETPFDTKYNAASDGIHVLEEGYDRACKIDVYKYTGNATIAEDEISGYASETPYNGGRVYLDVRSSGAIDNEAGELELKPTLMNLSGEISDSVSELTYRYESGESGDSGTIAVVDGVAKFVPDQLGEYEFTSGEYKQQLYVSNQVPPRITLVADLPEELTEGDALDISADNVSIESRWNCSPVEISCKFNETLFEPLPGQTAQAGIYKITYKVTDESGNTASCERIITVLEADTTPPEIVWQSPEYLIGGTKLTFNEIKAYDNDAEIPVVITEVSFLPELGESRTLSHDSEGVDLPNEDGRVTVKVQAVDAAGNISEKVYSVFVYVDEPEIVDPKPDEPDLPETPDEPDLPETPDEPDITESEDGGNNGLRTGLIVGGVVIAVALIGAGVWIGVKKRKKRE